jgi:nucleoid-associated protein YgaU
LHQLQIDQIESTGRVSAVLSLPFERADPSQISETIPGTIIVQPGASLWRIARRLYGEGWQYTLIYSQNQDQIRDPDLIYPGQVFAVPQKEQENPG